MHTKHNKLSQFKQWCFENGIHSYRLVDRDCYIFETPDGRQVMFDGLLLSKILSSTDVDLETTLSLEFAKASRT